jgi:hypothetical protein
VLRAEPGARCRVQGSADTVKGSDWDAWDRGLGGEGDAQPVVAVAMPRALQADPAAHVRPPPTAVPASRPHPSAGAGAADVPKRQRAAGGTEAGQGEALGEALNLMEALHDRLLLLGYPGMARAAGGRSPSKFYWALDARAQGGVSRQQQVG